MNIPVGIKSAIENDRLIVFAGAGLSIRFNLPSWPHLITDVIHETGNTNYNFIIEGLSNGLLPPLDALELIKNEHNLIRKYIKNHFAIKSGNLELHRAITELTGKIITTNYDDAFEKAAPQIVPTIHNSRFNVSEINKNDEDFIFKIHGSYTDPDTCVLFKEDYRRVYDQDYASTEKFKSLFSDNTILFLGFGFNDPDITELLRKFDDIYGNNNKHYIITKDTAGFRDFKFLEVIPVSEFSEIDVRISDFLDFKKGSVKRLDDLKPNLDFKGALKKIAFLTPDPLDINIKESVQNVIGCFDDLDIEIHTGHLNVNTLQLIDDFDVVIMPTKAFKGRLYIEDETLKSVLVPVDLICNSVLNERTILIFISEEELQLPEDYPIISIKSLKREVIKRFVFKAFRRGEMNFVDEQIKFQNVSTLPIAIGKEENKYLSIYGIKKNLDFSRKSLNVIGRIEEQAAIIKRVLNAIESNKLLNIKGSGGIGKTTLIKKVSWDLYNRGYFKQGVNFITCENVKSFVDFEQVILKGFNLLNIIDFKGYLKENRVKIDVLIILDNFETVTNISDSNDLEQIYQLLEFCVDYANIIVTSRESLGLPYEDVFTLTPLITDDALALFINEYGPVSNKAELQILRSEILENLLNNNPLAIKLVTKTSVRYFRMQELKDHLESHFFEATSEALSNLYKKDSDLNIERTKSIYQSINYSYSKLKTSEKLAFEILHLFPDGISLSNFKRCFAKTLSLNRISDIDMRHLRDKSLVEDENGLLYLQPIIRKFAEFQFFTRPIGVRQKYYNDAYVFNAFLLDVIKFIKDSKSFSDALRVQDVYKNNLIGILDYISYIDLSKSSNIDEKKYFINYIYELDAYIVNKKQYQDLRSRLNALEDYFGDVPFANTFLEVIKLQSVYYLEDFDTVYTKIAEILSPTRMSDRIFENEDYIERRYNDYIADIHSMEGYTIQLIECFVKNKSDEVFLINDFFYLGITDYALERQRDFYRYEYELITGKLDINKLEAYIDSLFSEEHLEIMQCTYTLSKVKQPDYTQIKKLVVTNPYTLGLKELMFAFVSENDTDIAKVHYENALKSLAHIRYFYLECLYYYTVFLKKNGDSQYFNYLDKGLNQAIELKYQYLHFKFETLKQGIDTPYVCDYNYYNIDGLEEYVKNHNAVWDERFKKEKLKD